MNGLWIFAYGSLIWDPGFPVQRRILAKVDGYRRGFYMLSVHHRGTPDVPGLVLALDKAEGASCKGSLLEVPRGSEDATMSYLRQRELVSSAYVETQVTAEADGKTYRAVTFVVDQKHEQYVPDLTPDEQIELIMQARGGRGTNLDYLWQTYVSLQEAGIPDAGIDHLIGIVSDIQRAAKNQELA